MTETNTPTATHRSRPAPVRDVQIHDAFWAPRQRQLRSRTLQSQFRQLISTGRLRTLALAWTPGSDEPIPHPFYESDIAKWIEAASYTLATHPDPEVEAMVDEAVSALAGAQQEDGYLNAYFTVVAPGQRFTDLRDAHELYGAGHMIEAGVAHYEATGKTSLLDVVTRYADLLVSEFGPGGALEGGYCGHEEIELALVRLYRTTGRPEYLELSRRFIDARGTSPFYFDAEERRRGTPGYFGGVFADRPQENLEFREYNQSHAPVREQTEPVGHAVRAMYLFSAMADLAAETDDESLADAGRTLWNHLTTRRMYVTGGIGDSRHNEGFTHDWALPNDTAYAETCAAIGLVMWAHRLACSTGEARYVDVLERALYNGVIAGVSADGEKYFYENPLASDGQVARKDWFDTACCPPNLARLEASLGAYVFGVADDALSVNLYLGAELRAQVAGASVTLRTQTDSPTPKHVELSLGLDTPGRFAVRLRHPAWASAVSISVNGNPVAADAGEDGYVVLDRTWADEDTVTVDLEVPVSRAYASTRVSSDAGKVALTHGPFVYCVEGVDLPVPAHAVVLDAAVPLIPEADRVGRVPRLVGTAWAESHGEHDLAALYVNTAPERERINLVATPYYEWNNRGRSTMAVWLRTS